MDIISVFEKVVEVTKMNTLEVTVWFVIVALFVWLYKEFKAQYQKNMDLRTAKTEKIMANLSKSLSVAYQYKSDSNKSAEFFMAVFDCFPLIDTDHIKDIENVINDISIQEKEKVEEIAKKLFSLLIYLSKENKELNNVKSGLEGLGYVLNKLKDIVIPVGQAFATLFVVLFLLIIESISDNPFIDFLRIMSVIFWVALPVGFIELFLKKKLKKNSIISIMLIFISLTLLTFQNNLAVTIIFVLVFVGSAISVVKFGYKP